MKKIEMNKVKIHVVVPLRVLKSKIYFSQRTTPMKQNYGTIQEFFSNFQCSLRHFNMGIYSWDQRYKCNYHTMKLVEVLH